MKKIDELQQLRGVGVVLAKRLRDAGLDTFERIASGGEDKVRAVHGINQHMVTGIVQQAALLSRPGEQEAQQGDAPDLAAEVEKVRSSLESVTEGARDRFAGRIAAKLGRRLSENVVRISDALNRIAESGRHPKRSQKGLAKVQRRIEGLDDVKLKKFCKGLKKSRKALTELAR